MMAAKSNIDLETYRLVKQAMASGISKDEFKKFLELKKAELKSKEKQD